MFFIKPCEPPKKYVPLQHETEKRQYFDSEWWHG